MVRVCDVVTINAPLHPETEHLFNDALIDKMKRGAYLVNTARGKICDRDAVVRALKSGKLAGYAGDVWFPQPPPSDHPWRTMPHHGMTPHTSGTSLSAQARYAAGTREILECWFEGRPIREEYLIVDSGKLAGTGAHSYSVGKTAQGAAGARFLENRAKRRTSISYQELAKSLQILPPHSIHRVTEALECLMEEDAAANRPLIAALAISRARGGLPASGFFDCARRLGRFAGDPDGQDAGTFHAAELNAVLARWGDNSDP